MYHNHICVTLAEKPTLAECTQFKAFIEIPKLHKELSETISITGLWQNKQHAEDKKVKPKEQEV